MTRYACTGCGSTMTDAEILEGRKVNPLLMACCPERNMQPVFAQPFQVGDKVRSVPPQGKPNWVSDWQDLDLWVAGVRFCTYEGWMLAICEQWPPTSRSVMIDGWTPDLLVKVEND